MESIAMFYKYDKGYINIKKIIQIVRMSDGAVVYLKENKVHRTE